MTTINHWVNNEVFAGASGATAPVTNPATGAVTGEVALASVEDARARWLDPSHGGINLGFPQNG